MTARHKGRRLVVHPRGPRVALEPRSVAPSLLLASDSQHQRRRHRRQNSIDDQEVIEGEIMTEIDAEVVT